MLVTWQTLFSAGWTSGWLGVGAGVLALFASAGVIIVHHLGYVGFRGRAMVFPVVGCLVLSLASMITGSPIAPIGGHIILHIAMMRRGVELPPDAESTGEAQPKLVPTV